ncbi:MAG: hypothetical protein Q4D20_07325 [Clostridia bacterium]|nr:hypothetical protein [Clostridia bacterium]
MNERNNVLVCVTPQESSKKLIEAGRILAEKNDAELQVITVLPLNGETQKDCPKMLDALFQTVRDSKGEMAVYFSDDPAFTIAAHMAKTKPIVLVVGFPGENSNNFISLIHLLVPDTPISMVDKDNRIYNMLPFEENQSVH